MFFIASISNTHAWGSLILTTDFTSAPIWELILLSSLDKLLHSLYLVLLRILLEFWAAPFLIATHPSFIHHFRVFLAYWKFCFVAIACALIWLLGNWTPWLNCRNVELILLNFNIKFLQLKRRITVTLWVLNKFGLWCRFVFFGLTAFCLIELTAIVVTL